MPILQITVVVYEFAADREMFDNRRRAYVIAQASILSRCR